MPMDLLRTQANERVDLGDFQYISDSIMEHQKQVADQFFTDPARTRQWILSGFELSNPSGKQVQVDKGKAILATRLDGAVQYGMLTTEGDASKIIDMATGYGSGTFYVYIRFEQVPNDQQSRIFWDPTGDGSEFSQTIETRYAANWSMRIESSSPGDEWMLIAEVTNNGNISITDQRNLFFEGEVHNTYRSGWGAVALGGSANDRNSDRQQYGVTDLQMFSASVRQCLEDIKGRGLKRWWDPDIGGMNIGFDADPTSGHLAIGDVDFFLELDTNPMIRLDGTDDYFQHVRGSPGELQLIIGTGLSYSWTDQDFRMYDDDPGFWMKATGAASNQKTWEMTVQSDGRLKLFAWNDGEDTPTTPLEIIRSGTTISDINWIGTNFKITGNLLPDSGVRVGTGYTTLDPGDGNVVCSGGLSLGVEAQPTVGDIMMSASTQGIFSAADTLQMRGDANNYMTIDTSGTGVFTWRVNGNDEMVLDDNTLEPSTDLGLYLGDTNKRWGKIYSNDIIAYGNAPVLSIYDADEATADMKWFKITSVSASDAVEMRFYDDLETSWDTIFTFTRITDETVDKIKAGGDLIADSDGSFDLGGTTGYWDFGYMDNLMLRTAGAASSGTANWVTFTGEDNGTTAGAGSVLSNSNDNTGFLSIWVGENKRYIPYWTAIS